MRLRLGPDPNWKLSVTFLLNLYPKELITLAKRYNMPGNIVDNLVKVGKALLKSISEAGVHLFALLTMCAGITDAKLAKLDMNDKETKDLINVELAVVKLVKWARVYDGFQNLKIVTGTRVYDVSLPQPGGS